MSVTLDYSTVQQVAPNVRQAIIADAKRVAVSHDWWCERLDFYEPDDSDGRLEGGNKIHLIGYTTDDGGYRSVDDIDEDDFMALRDTLFVLEQLARWSERFSLTWVLECAGERVGAIDHGRWDRPLHQYVQSWFGSAQFDPSDPSCEERARAISAKYASRR
jgi:hypothetical protein